MTTALSRRTDRTDRTDRTERGGVPDLLRAHVPLSLLLDLADPAGPHSGELYEAEHESADWVPQRR